MAKMSRITDFADRAKAYGIPAMIVDGNDIIAVYETTRKAIAMCRKGEGPVLIESKTFRRRGHAQHDPAKYVPAWMLKEWEAKDPITRYEKYLSDKKLWTPKEKKEILDRVARELKEDQAAAEASPLPPAERAAEGVYCDDECHTIAPDWKRKPEDVKKSANNKTEWFEGRQPAHAPNPNGSIQAAKPSGKGKKTIAKKARARKG